jgi:hypothetical protein
MTMRLQDGEEQLRAVDLTKHVAPDNAPHNRVAVFLETERSCFPVKMSSETVDGHSCSETFLKTSAVQACLGSFSPVDLDIFVQECVAQESMLPINAIACLDKMITDYIHWLRFPSSAGWQWNGASGPHRAQSEDFSEKIWVDVNVRDEQYFNSICITAYFWRISRKVQFVSVCDEPKAYCESHFDLSCCKFYWHGPGQPFLSTKRTRATCDAGFAVLDRPLVGERCKKYLDLGMDIIVPRHYTRPKRRRQRSIREGCHFSNVFVVLVTGAAPSLQRIHHLSSGSVIDYNSATLQQVILDAARARQVSPQESDDDLD